MSASLLEKVSSHCGLILARLEVASQITHHVLAHVAQSAPGRDDERIVEGATDERSALSVPSSRNPMHAMSTLRMTRSLTSRPMHRYIPSGRISHDTDLCDHPRRHETRKDTKPPFNG